MPELKSCHMVGYPHLEGKYSQVLDMWPLEAPELNRIYPFYDNLKQGRWTTTRCRKCGYVAYPPGVLCPQCWSEDLEWIDLPQTATVVALNEMASPAVGFDPPLINAWLGFDPAHPLKHLFVRILNARSGQVKVGDEVRLVIFEVPAHPLDVKKETKVCERVYYAFEPVQK
jgi:uncharacterized protein